MNIEEDLTSLKEIVAIRKERCDGFIESDGCLISTKRLETLLTAYEKEKEKAEYENELRIKYQKRYDSVKEKNKELEKQLQLTYQKQYINDLEAINHSNVSFN